MDLFRDSLAVDMRFSFMNDVRLFSAVSAWRVISTVAFAAIVFNLFYLGSKPVAVGLFQPPMDKVAHFVTFSAMTFLLWLGLLRGRAWLLLPIGGVIAGADEIHQTVLPGRSPSLGDYAFDIAAVFLTTAVLVWVERMQKRRRA